MLLLYCLLCSYCVVAFVIVLQLLLCCYCVVATMLLLLLLLWNVVLHQLGSLKERLEQQETKMKVRIDSLNLGTDYTEVLYTIM